MFKRCLSPLTLVNQLALIVLLSTAIGVAGMAISGWLVQGVQGSAHAINKAGSLRMQSYRLLAAVPLSAHDQKLLDEMKQTAFSPELTRAAERDGQQEQLRALQDYWHTELAPGLQRAQDRNAVAGDVMRFVSGLDRLVTAFDHTTELRIERVVMVHRLMAIFMALLFVFTIIWLRARLLQPWKQLLSMARAVSQRDFTQRAHISGRNEMAMLGSALNNMSEELAESYAVLEQRVQEKTAGLEHKNQILSFLWQANRRLHSQVPLCERLSPVLNGLQNLTLLHDIELRVYDLEDEDNHQEFTCQSDSSCDDKGCHLCPRGALPAINGGTTLKWRLTDAHTQYGILLATLPHGRHLSHDQQQMIDTLVEQLTATLALDRNQERQQQLIVMEERATIARELHDSIAQSLSCMKMQVSCLQMQGATLPESSRELLSQIRNELNTSWVQLRELLTTFRLQLTEPGLRPALEASCQEYSARFGFTVKLDYQLPPRRVPSHQAIHLLQIAREALSNALKHSHADEVAVAVVQNGNQVKLTVKDNGCGVPENAERSNHYGMIIMRDRAQSLRGDCRVRRRETGGTEVAVTFIPETNFTEVQGDTQELSGTGYHPADRRSSDVTDRC
ncbi:nitrate/nitrite two-component system sensor histidine kinase NarX [Citrobacter sp. CK180]|uniref:nitrate/nitrite two-component system sensor histidine kinase NarX n=1 Tax=Citrobacter sp. CK180 TaxID=2985089 RepID=UPI002578ADA9|nr:nitrate/nitrite two-component system sensor histidine kinase NarX [Citrobacter sp. CK180]MDM3066074.1 nitrate/nitrite two-component system sensor histidine kinase NarX [Citrobacter sp. CK180]